MRPSNVWTCPERKRARGPTLGVAQGEKRRALAMAAALFWLSPAVHAQGSLVADKKTTEGKTDVAQEGFQKAEAPVIADINETNAKLMAGAFLSTGNARALALTAAGSLRLRRGADQFSADLAANYAQSAADSASDLGTTVENYQGRVRYDRFLSAKWALFGQVSGRRDRFQGLDLRLNFDPGAAYYFVMEEKQHLTFELGYDMQYDVRSEDAILEAQTAGTPITASEVRHAARLYAGYDNSLNEHVTFETGLEYLQAFSQTENFRLNWVSALSAALAGNFAAAIGFTLRYDNNPLPGISNLDTITTLNLVYTLQ